MDEYSEDDYIEWVTLKSEPSRPRELIPRIKIEEQRITISKQNELGDEEDDE